MQAHFILYVKNQQASARFYRTVLAREPVLDVPGMTEFRIADGAVLGLMPEQGIKRLLGAGLPDPARARGVPRAEIYLVVDDPRSYHARALAGGAREVSPLVDRDWGHRVAYSLDDEGHLLAFAEPLDVPGGQRS